MLLQGSVAPEIWRSLRTMDFVSLLDTAAKNTKVISKKLNDLNSEVDSERRAEMRRIDAEKQAKLQKLKRKREAMEKPAPEERKVCDLHSLANLKSSLHRGFRLREKQFILTRFG